MEKLGAILLIDDDTICSYLNQQLLEEMQMIDSIICLNDGQEALDYLKKANASKTEVATIRPDLIFMDLNMPGLDGFQVLDQLSEIGGSNGLIVKRVVILSTSMHPVDQERVSKYDVFDYLVKPFTETKIKGVIDRFLESQQPHPKFQNKAANLQTVKDRHPVEKPVAEGIEKKLKKERG